MPTLEELRERMLTSGLRDSELTSADRDVLQAMATEGLVTYQFGATGPCWTLTDKGRARLTLASSPVEPEVSPRAQQVLDALLQKPDLAVEVFRLLAKALGKSGDAGATYEPTVTPESIGPVRTRPQAAVQPQIVSPPKPKRASCDSCGAGIAYLPEHVEEHHGRDYGGGPDGFKRVKCPRPGCPGHGYIERW